MLKKDDLVLVLEGSKKDPLWFMENVLGWELPPWDKQIEIVHAIRDFDRVTVRSGHGVGKTYIVSRIALWFLYTHVPSIVLTTAPTFRQVETVLWGEIRQAHRNARVKLGGTLLQTQIKIDDKWYALGFSTDDADRMQGYHEENILIIFDEAAGIPEEIWNAADGLLASPNAKLLAIGNPTSVDSRFYQTHKDPTFHKIHISCYDHPNVKEKRIIYPKMVTYEWVVEMKRKWGENSPLYQAKVLGEFPEQETNTLIPIAWLDECIASTVPTVGENYALGVDIARFGDDSTVIAVVKGNTLLELKVYSKEDLMQTTGRIVNAIKKYSPEYVNIDDTGLGGGVVDRLRELGYKVNGINFGSSAEDKEHFADKRTEIYWNLRERIQRKEIQLLNDPELHGDLTSPRYKYTSKGQIKLESKEELKSRLGRSPDKGDAVALAFYKPVKKKAVSLGLDPK